MLIDKSAPFARKVEGEMSFEEGQNSFVMTIISPDRKMWEIVYLGDQSWTIWRKMVAPKLFLKRFINFLVWKVSFFLIASFCCMPALLFYFSLWNASRKDNWFSHVCSRRLRLKSSTSSPGTLLWIQPCTKVGDSVLGTRLANLMQT